MDLLTQLNRAMEYVEEHICDESINVSSVTTYSIYHFSRLFNYITEIPLSEYIRKRKLSRAAMDLQNTGEKVIDIAVKYGYDSADSFTRAFVKQHGATPTIARKTGVTLTLFPPMTFQIKIEGARSMNWRIEKKEAFEVVGVERRFKNDETDKLPAFWREVFDNGSMGKLAAQTGCDDFMAACVHIGDKADDFSYLIGVPVKEGMNTSGFDIVDVMAANWAVFRSNEFDENQYGTEIQNLFKRAYTEWLPSSGYEKLTGCNEIYDMEIYGVTNNGKYFEEVWISVVKK